MNQELPIIISLAYPVTAFGEEIKELAIKRRPTAKDLRSMDAEKGEVAKVVALAAKLTEMPTSTIDSLDAADFGKLSEAVSGFLS